MIYFCCDALRRNALVGSALNGIDYLEVLDHEIELSDPANRQKKLIVHFINDLAAGALDRVNICIEGGERTANLFATSVALDALDAKLLRVSVNDYGDFSIYTLRLVRNPQNLAPPAIIDALFAAVDFSFKVDCPSDFDCQPRCDCPATAVDEPEINYLAKDYASFRRLMLDRMSTLMPQWRERNAADLGVALVETLAYVGDHLSYEQDAVATEAYLGTARRRVSVRRHAKLVDYQMHDGCNARAWVQLRVSADVIVNLGTTQFFTRIPGQPTVLLDDPQPRPQAIFEPVESVGLFAAHNEFKLYTWSDQRCCLPKGATDATLAGSHANLTAGHVLMFEEVIGPNTGRGADADPSHRWAVRLTAVQALDALNQPLRDPLTNEAITQIAWSDADALPFALCVSAQTDRAHGARFIDNVSVARGNLVLADHGATLRGEALGSVGAALPVALSSNGCARCQPPDLAPLSPRFRPTLAKRPLTFAAPHDPSGAASAALVWSERDAAGQIELTSVHQGDTSHWQARSDLLQSKAADSHFVVEIESDGQTALRFGDDALGRRPKPTSSFTADYRVGNGRAGNVGAESLAHLRTSDGALAAAVTEVRNPLAARGGVEPESMEQVRAYAPAAYRTQERAVTEADYAAVAGRHPGVQRAMATFRWTGSWHTVFITVDRQGGKPVDKTFAASVRRFVEPFRMAGHDLEIAGPLPVSLEIAMHVCADAGYFRADVKRQLLELFSRREFANGQRGLFHPDNFTFGQTVYLSPLIAAAQAVAGVTSVQVTKFQRQGKPSNQALAAGKLELGRLEIARYDDKHLLLILQVDHSKVTGWFAAHWGNDKFARPSPYAAMVLAAQEHDTGWWDWEIKPQLNADGLPPDYIGSIKHLGGKVWLDFYRHGIERLAEQDPYAGYIVSLHSDGLMTQGRGLLPYMPDYTIYPEVKAFLHEQESYRAELMKQLQSLDEYRDWVSQEQLWKNFKLMEVYDQIGQFVCNRYPFNSTARKNGPSNTMSNVPTPTLPGKDDTILTFNVMDESRATVTPYPFDIDPLPVSFQARLLPKRRYPNQNEFLREYYGAERIMINYSLHSH